MNSSTPASSISNKNQTTQPLPKQPQALTMKTQSLLLLAAAATTSLAAPVTTTNATNNLDIIKQIGQFVNKVIPATNMKRSDNDVDIIVIASKHSNRIVPTNSKRSENDVDNVVVLILDEEGKPIKATDGVDGEGGMVVSPYADIVGAADSKVVLGE